MKIEKDAAVSFHYTLTDGKGEELDSSQGRPPLTYLHGHGQIIDGLERRMEGLEPGARVNLAVPAAEAYGERNAEMLFEVERAQFPADANLAVGEHVMSNGPGEQRVFTVAELRESSIVLDANHPLAGRDLHFSVEVVEVRQATADELAHGHAHGEGGHGH